MTGHSIRRLFQMVVVTLLVAVVTHFLFNIAPGGPSTGLRQQQQRLKPTDIARIRGRLILDLIGRALFTPVIRVPTGPLTIGDDLFANLPVGCYLLNDDQSCADYVYLAEIPELHPAVRSSKGILRGDFGQSTVVRIGAPVSEELRSRIIPTLELG